MTQRPIQRCAAAGLLSMIVMFEAAIAETAVRKPDKAVPQCQLLAGGSDMTSDPLRGNQDHCEEMLEEAREQTRPEGIGDEDYYEFIYKEKQLYTDEGAARE